MQRGLTATTHVFAKDGEGDVLVNDVFVSLEIAEMENSFVELAWNVKGKRYYLKFDLAELVRQAMRKEGE